MKKIIKALALTLAFIMLLTMSSCLDGTPIGTPIESPKAPSVDGTEAGGEIPKTGLWAKALYTSDQTFGTGTKTVMVDVKAGEYSVTLTINTDRDILGDALLDHNLVEGENGQYGLYIKKVNGITADYDIDASYWGFYKGGEYMMTGVDQTRISGGEHYELVYTK